MTGSRPPIPTRDATPAAAPQLAKRARPDSLRGATWKVESALGDVFVTINNDPDGNPFEIFAVLGKGGSVIMADLEAICRLASLALRFGIGIADLHHQLRGISSDRASGSGAAAVLSVPDAIAHAIGSYLADRAERRPTAPAT